MKLRNQDYDITISEDPTYRLFSVDNKPYELIIEMEQFDKGSHYRTMDIEVINLSDYTCVNIAIVCGIYSFCLENCAVLDGVKLIVLTQDAVAFVDLKLLKLIRNCKVLDFGTAVAIYPFCGNYIIHGELEIVLINTVGEKLWSFSGRNIFVLPEEKSYLNIFKIENETAIFYDWEGNKYIIDKMGKEVLET